MVNVNLKLFRYDFKELLFDLVDIFAHGKLGAIGNAVNVSVHGDIEPAALTSK